MSTENSLPGVLFKFVLVLVLGLIVLLGALVVIGGDGAKAVAEAGAPGDGKAGGPALSTHDETLVFRFRELFGHETLDPAEELAVGITAIREDTASEKPIDLYRLLELCRDIDRDADYLADRTTRVEQAIGWFIVNGRLHARLRTMQRPRQPLQEGVVDPFRIEIDARATAHTAP